MDSSTKEARIALAIEDLANQAVPNLKATAARFQLVRTTLMRRFKRMTQSQRVARSESQQCLSLAQEEALVSYITSLTERSMPPTSQIVHNLAEEIRGRPVNKNWVAGFTRRYQDRILGVHLRTIDNKRVKADNPLGLEAFYKLVCIYIYTSL
jgi:AraC-like DNA-binding protein